MRINRGQLMEEKAGNEVCHSCKKGELIEGTLEGVSFQPLSEAKKWLSSGVYGIHATACSNCGRILDMAIDTQTLRRIVGTSD